MTTENKAAVALASRIVAGAVANARPLDEVKDLLEHQVRNRIRVDDDGNISVVDDTGVPRVSMRPGCPSMTLEEYLDELKASKPMLFRSPGNSSTSTASATSETNPFAAKTWNISRQMILMRQDPAKAARLEAEARQ